ncbi:MAG TPA: DNA polymerase I [Chloroflexota bacterium]|nr:DNA polymerase I [Chloroflexota bacterium]
MTDGVRLMLLDGHSLVHRAFHAVPEGLATSEGELTNAVFGFASMLLKAIETVRPTHIVMAMDRPAPTFRHQAYAEYKATRPSTPPELRSQFRRVRQVAAALNIPIYEMDGFEADDVLGTLSLQAEEAGVETVLVTGDLDALQLVSDEVRVMTLGRGVTETVVYDTAGVEGRYSISPEKLPDWKSLVGDTSDNIPGVPGIGAKGASKLVAQYGSLEAIFEHLNDLPARQRVALEENRDQVFRSRELATIIRNVPMELRMDEARFRDLRRSELIELFQELEFRSLIERLQEMIPRPTAPVAGGPVQQLSMFGDTAPARDIEVTTDDGGVSVTNTTAALSTSERGHGETVTRVVQDAETLQALVSELREAGSFAVDTETTSTDPLHASLVGFSFSTSPQKAWYVPVGHAEGNQLPLHLVADALKPVLEDQATEKVGHNLKYDYTVLQRHGISLGGSAFDTMIAAYLVNPNARGLSLSSLALARFGIEMTPIEELIGKGKSQITMDLVDINRVAAYAGADADITLRLKGILNEELSDRELLGLFRNVEMPLVPVLAEMEAAGIALDSDVLTDMSREMTQQIGAIEGRIFEIAGHHFNINSTQQLGQVLFGELKLPAGRRTKTGYSTDSEVLERLRGKHEIVDLILEYRQLIKLKNTYVDALPTLLDPQDHRIHTDFNQTVAATGRLSSSNPNLQNIPVRGEVGRKIRRAFVPGCSDHVLLAADYSQIELRILAAMSGDERLVTAFREGEDVHVATAAAVFGVPLDQVTPDQRRIAKVVNFGIIYGIGEQRLAHETGISRDEAGEFIANYNRTYAGVKSFMDNMRRTAALYGYVSTMLGRRRYIPDIHARNPGIQQAAERAAINMPIQGTAADIIKIAMIRIDELLRKQHPESRMVLQVHDELVFDVPRNQLEPVAGLVREAMVSATNLSVPLDVELKAGPNWYEMQPLVA